MSKEGSMALTTQQKNFLRDGVRDSSNNLALIARAGCGKTHSLIKACEVLPENLKILALAFNKSIATELQERLPAHAKAMTMNSLGHRAWQSYINTKITLNADKVGGILRKLCKDNPNLWSYWSDITTLISKARIHGLVPNGSEGEYKSLLEDTDENWNMLREEYGIEKSSVMTDYKLFRDVLKESISRALQGEIDFTDQIFMSALWDTSFEHFDVILIDEHQDNSLMDHVFIQKLMQKGTRLIVVGDDKQSLYLFRGAASDSIKRSIEKYNCTVFPLTVSFRCPRSVIRVAQQDVPDIEAREDAPEGVVKRLDHWSAETIEKNAAILCRNVAPLVRCTYRLIAAGKPAVMEGRDIGKGLITLVGTLIKPAKNMSTADFLVILEDWKDNEIQIARVQGKPYKEESAMDKYDSIIAVQSYSRAKDVISLIAGIDTLFAASAEHKILLSTVHRAKGREFNTVYILDDWRIPSKYAKDAKKKALKGWEEQMQQEYNLRYVAVTRAKEKLFYIQSDQYESKVPEPAIPGLDAIEEGEEE